MLKQQYRRRQLLQKQQPNRRRRLLHAPAKTVLLHVSLVQLSARVTTVLHRRLSLEHDHVSETTAAQEPSQHEWRPGKTLVTLL